MGFREEHIARAVLCIDTRSPAYVRTYGNSTEIHVIERSVRAAAEMFSASHDAFAESPARLGFTRKLPITSRELSRQIAQQLHQLDPRLARDEQAILISPVADDAVAMIAQYRSPEVLS